MLLALGFVIADRGSSFDELYLAEMGDSVRVVKPEPHHSSEAALIAALLSQHHFGKIALNDSMASRIFDAYISGLDNFKLYFLQKDIQDFERFRYKLDDRIKDGDVTFAYRVQLIFQQRVRERLNRLPVLLNESFDFSQDEYLETDPQKISWPTTADAQDARWRQNLKAQALSLVMVGKDEESVKKTLTERYKRLEKYIFQINSEDVFQNYMNALSMSYDPHTNYFSPVTADNFEISMNLSLEGIGARLTVDNDYVTFSEIIPGGPAFKSKRLFPKDRIVGVAQEMDTSYTDVIGWRLDEAVKLIRGPKGSQVKLQVLPRDADFAAKPMEIILVRDKIKLEEQAASQKIMEVQRQEKIYRIGVVTIPSFYRAFEDIRNGETDFSSTTRDVKNILEKLKAEKVDGVVIDLRQNGGGALTEAVELTGLFIDRGPVVQVKNSNGSVDVFKDEESGVAYDGPLAVLMNRFSASASEIFAGAIQDYKRGIVVGETSYGKGTVQNLIDLERFMSSGKGQLGQLKLTLAKYYRVNGSSTQHLGVVPDIALPSVYSAEEYGESSQPYALPWDQIMTSNFTPVNRVNEGLLARLNQKFVTRLETDADLKELVKAIEDMKETVKDTRVSLQIDKRKAEIEALQQKRLSQEQLMEEDLLGDEVPDTGKAETEARKDTYLQECLQAIADWIQDVS